MNTASARTDAILTVRIRGHTDTGSTDRFSIPHPVRLSSQSNIDMIVTIISSYPGGRFGLPDRSFVR